eukprot:CAMPEP_0197654826 /NCGR_PEP_ID=MMETSP1338-20131121/39082_1 /TAXON_ID=43686 ORGANISM="Pelagodinium beii, Strain RCC1491" /NCGR_SAMPLE_ID=MMETSP1338 /ASSEMBLY_ACC=CAM_ASM_000754 /LENGTH=202 /DNA_ID=CAMNT_0043230343 /DNA_START=35 /DNA_END=643 /DNA_ORIENTATION=+
MQPPQPARRHAPLPPLNNPRGSQLAAVTAASASRPELGAYPSTGSSVSSSRPSSTSSFLVQDLQVGQFSSRSTSASSQHSDGQLVAGAGELLNSIVSATGRQDQQAELVVKAMLPIVKRAMVSKNQAVVQASLDSMRRIERMFGQEAIDRNIESLAEALEKQHSKPGGDTRCALILKTLTTLCSPEACTSLQRRFPEQVGAA